VVDTNLIAYLLIEGPHTGLAKSVYQRYEYHVVPAFWRIEFLNILATYAKAGLLPFSEAEIIWKEGLRLNLLEEDPDMRAVLDLAIKNRCSVYDALFVAVAMEHGLPLITLDGELVKKFPQIAISPKSLLEKK
jgi:predicted nucleic acid-binding protein